MSQAALLALARGFSAVQVGTSAGQALHSLFSAIVTRRGSLCVTDDGGSVSFRSSLHLMSYISVHPHVFISTAATEASKKVAAYVANSAVGFGLGPLLFTSREAVDAVSNPGRKVGSWEEWMAIMLKETSFTSCIVVLSKEYVARANDEKQGGGVYIEWQGLKKASKKGQLASARVRFAYVGKWHGEYLTLMQEFDDKLKRDNAIRVGTPRESSGCSGDEEGARLMYDTEAGVALAASLIPDSTTFAEFLHRFCKPDKHVDHDVVP
jgi:hypothetical protein